MLFLYQKINQRRENVIKKKVYISLTTGEIIEGKMEVIKTIIHDLQVVYSTSTSTNLALYESSNNS